MTLTITGFYTTLLAFIIIWLARRVVRLRVKHKIGLLDGQNPELIRAIRIHANTVEWVPMALILFACAESQQMAFWFLHILGIILIISRSLHIWGLSRSSGRSFGRLYGMAGTWLVILILGIFNLNAFFSHIVFALEF